VNTAASGLPRGAGDGPPATEASQLRERRARVVERHVAVENDHDVQGIIDTFHRPHYELVALGEPTDGEAAVRDLWHEQFAAFPDFHVEVLSTRHADDVVFLEVEITGTHRGPFMGVPATGRRVRFRAACVFEFEGDRLMNERVYFDAATQLQQLGVMPQPGAPD
jgi:steroid delta-isomerase-like uncharacterized protein